MQPFQSVIYDINKNVYSTPQSAWSPFSHIKYNNKNMSLDTEVPGFIFSFVIRPDKTMSYTATMKASLLLAPWTSDMDKLYLMPRPIGYKWGIGLLVLNYYEGGVRGEGPIVVI